MRRYAVVLLWCEVGLFAFFVAGTHGWIVDLPGPCSSDFVSFYAAGLLHQQGTPALAYDHAAHYASEQWATEPGIAYNFFFYPPVFLLVCAALARLPYLVAFVTFQIGSLLPCLALARRIAGPVPAGTLLAFPAVFWTAGTGQNAFVTAALLAGATLSIDRRPVVAGLLFGALCYKPHFGLLIPVALVAGGHWRALTAAAISVLGLVMASGLAFGWETWSAFLETARAAGSVYGTSETSVDLSGMTSPFGLTLALGGSPVTATVLQSAVTLGVMAAVAWVWGRRGKLAVRAAVLLAAIPVAVPVVMFYDLMLTGLAVAWLFRAGQEEGFPSWQRSGLAVVFVIPFVSGNVGFAGQTGFPPAAAALGFALALRQALVSRVRPSRLALQVSSNAMPGSPLAIARR